MMSMYDPIGVEKMKILILKEPANKSNLNERKHETEKRAEPAVSNCTQIRKL